MLFHALLSYRDTVYSANCKHVASCNLRHTLHALIVYQLNMNRDLKTEIYSVPMLQAKYYLHEQIRVHPGSVQHDILY